MYIPRFNLGWVADTCVSIFFLSILVEKLRRFEVVSFIEKLKVKFVHVNLSKLWCNV